VVSLAFTIQRCKLFNDLIGKPFTYGGRGPTSYDCYGLALEVSRRVGIKLPEHASNISPPDIHKSVEEGLGSWQKLDYPEPYCIVVFCIVPPYVSHVGVVLPYSKFIHITSNTCVTIERYDREPWALKVRGFYKWQG
jgi:cell wall-associated NlpC family hydrolase